MIAGIPDGYIWLVAAIVAAPYLFRAVQIGRRRKGLVKFRLKRLGISLSLYLGGTYVWASIGHPVWEAIIFGFLLGVAGGFFFVRPPRQDRRIPAHVKRAVIARDLKGEPFDPTVHHIHHVVPFSKGGDNSTTNLKALTKTENLRRGSRMPSTRDLL
jgi:hypothetical protein